MINLNEIWQLFKQIWFFRLLSIDGNHITISNMIIGVLLLVVSIKFSRHLSKKVVSSLIKKYSNIETGSLHTLETLVFYLFIVISTLFSLKLANIPITVFTLLGGALAIGIGFGSQNIVNNFISGLILMLERPIEVGDILEVDDSYGIIDDIGMRSTKIISPGNKHIIVPNAYFLDKKVVNWTHVDRTIKSAVVVGVNYGSDSRQVEELLLEVANGHDRVSKSPKANVWFKDFGDNALIFELNFWFDLKNITDSDDIKSDIRHSIYQILNANDIGIAFPQRDIHLYPKKPIEVSLLKN